MQASRAFSTCRNRNYAAMPKWISGPRDFWTGAVYIAIGSGALWLAMDYKLGTASRMGPGYFPRILAVILIGIGVVSLVRSFFVKGEPIADIAWKPLVFVCGAIIAYGLLVAEAGLVVALVALILGGAAASREFRLDPKALAGMCILIAVCVAVFIKGLGLPIPIVGPGLKAVMSAIGIVI